LASSIRASDCEIHRAVVDMHKVLTVEGIKRAAFKESHRSDKVKLAFVMVVMKLLLKIALPVSVRTEHR
jgi:hypothetical protein